MSLPGRPKGEFRKAQPEGTPVTTPDSHLAHAQQAGRGFIMRGPEGEVVMLNLLRLRNVADDSDTAELASATPISGAGAFNGNIPHTRPVSRDSGGELPLEGAA